MHLQPETYHMGLSLTPVSKSFVLPDPGCGLYVALLHGLFEVSSGVLPLAYPRVDGLESVN